MKVYDFSWADRKVFISDKECELKDMVNDRVVEVAKLELSEIEETHRFDDSTYVTTMYPAIKVKFDRTFVEGDLQTSFGSEKRYTYTLTIPEASFGDENFAKYLKDPKSVSKSDCHVNAFIQIYFEMTNRETVGIDITPISEEEYYSKQNIYDLSGRKVEKITKKGFYIINGKKKYVK